MISDRNIARRQAFLAHPRVHKPGDIREDGKVFWAYQQYSRGFEYWIPREHFDRLKAGVNSREKSDAVQKRRLEYRLRPENLQRKRALQKVRAALPLEKAKRVSYNRLMDRTDLDSHVKTRLRSRMRKVVRSALGGAKTYRKEDAEGVLFLVWSAERLGVTILNSSLFHVDHLIPFDRWHDEPREYKINAPENVRWLTATENLQKHSRMPTAEEMQAHFLLVAEWRSSQKPVVLGSK